MHINCLSVCLGLTESSPSHASLVTALLIIDITSLPHFSCAWGERSKHMHGKDWGGASLGNQLHLFIYSMTRLALANVPPNLGLGPMVTVLVFSYSLLLQLATWCDCMHQQRDSQVVKIYIQCCMTFCQQGWHVIARADYSYAWDEIIHLKLGKVR